MENQFGMLWRFAPMADDYVSEWHSRDLDATILEREVAAVQEWKKTNYTFHIMRDNPAHGAPLLGVNSINILRTNFLYERRFLRTRNYRKDAKTKSSYKKCMLKTLMKLTAGGMFGIQQHTNDSKQMRKAEFIRMLQEFGSGWSKGNDQTALAVVLMAPASEDSVVHDSYLCQGLFIKGALSLPFPTQRLSGPNFTIPGIGIPNFVGNTGNYAINHTCPEECRPKNHKDWLLC